MKKKTIITIAAALLLVALSAPLLCYISFIHILGDCFWWECAPKRNFHVQDWELPANLFPNESIVNRINTPSEGTGEIESGSQSMFWKFGTAGYSIKRYSTNRFAIEEFDFDVKHMSDDGTKKPWVRPNELAFSSPTADEIFIACGYNVQGRHCGMTVRYQEYVIYFSSTIGDKMTYPNFEKILAYIDEQISTRLYP